MRIFETVVILAIMINMAMAQFPTPEDTKKMVNVCMSENTGAEKQQFVDYSDDKLKIIPEPMKCVMKCFMEKMGYYDVGKTELKIKVFFDIVSKFAPPAEVEKAIAACKDQKGTNACDTGFLTMSCMWKNKVMQGSYIALTGKPGFT